MRCVLLLLLAVCSVSAAITPRGVTNEDIRDAILSLVHMFRENTDKLERHEMRERVLGDHLKKALSNLDKRQRTMETNMENVAVTLGKLDARLSTIENKLDHQSSEHDKGVYTVDTMQGSLQNWMTNMETMLRNMSMRQESGERVEALEAALSARLDSMAAVVERMEAHSLRSPPTAVASVDTDAIISRVDARLVRLQSQDDALTELRNLALTVSHGVAELPTRSEMMTLLNTSTDQITDLKYELISGVDKNYQKLDSKIEDTRTSLTTSLEELHKSSSDAVVMAEDFHGSVQKSYEQLLKEVKGLAKVEQVMIQTADNVLDTKRRIEYGVHQILLEIGELVKLQMKDLNTTINKRFDNISYTILDNQNGGLTNLSSKIEYEISQVWRQIGIMYQQLTASAGVLDRLQQQTDAYVNGSLTTMDSMEDKVSQITSRMGVVHENLNYLLGRFSLVTHEFNEIKSGLGASLDSIRNTFKTVQEQIKTVGPGPNPIPTGEADVDNQV